MQPASIQLYTPSCRQRHQRDTLLGIVKGRSRSFIDSIRVGLRESAILQRNAPLSEPAIPIRRSSTLLHPPADCWAVKKAPDSVSTLYGARPLQRTLERSFSAGWLGGKPDWLYRSRFLHACAVCVVVKSGVAVFREW